MLKSIFTFVMVLAIALAPTAGFAKIKWPFRKAKAEQTSKSVKSTKSTTKVAKAKDTSSKKASRKQSKQIHRDVQKLESLLAGTKTSAKLSDKSWKSLANEADALADRIYVNVKSATSEKHPLRAAEDLRSHVAKMKKEAYQGDYRNTRRHAERALSVAYKLDEWAG